MSTVITDSSRYAAIAAAIRAKNGETAQYTPAQMPAKISAITTGAELDYAIVCAPERPDTAVKNTLWVENGGTPNGVYFSLTAPGTPAANTLWIEQGTQSAAPFDPIKNGGITVYPRRAKQYMSATNEWLLRYAQLYDGAEWKDLSIPIYNYGDEVSAISGGWKAESAAWATAGSGIIATLKKNADHLFVTAQSYNIKNGSGYRLKSVLPIDLTDTESIGMRISELSGEGVLGVLAEGETYMDTAVCRTVTGADGTTPADTRLDVSSLTGKYSVCLMIRCTEAKVMTLKAKVHKCWIY